MKNLLKIIACTVLGISILLSGCETYKGRQLTESEIRYREQYKQKYPIQIPEHMKYTIFDPCPFAHAPQHQPKLINEK